jgi:hypothetical protein
MIYDLFGGADDRIVFIGISRQTTRYLSLKRIDQIPVTGAADIP